ncbi:VanZ like protein [Mobilisporobacter senegalensis]|uniref:VanZ like protein n=1 Tax=Mobilisporobacter senegalensis TaxID=1329262 RepID=A0A3N1XMR7_9FIRM|nr:VanZ family protein [Mobilisporobacter senegalensis]ROR27488.1 VanZ like protein [Mobilisporobacter senegalensis]
MNIIKKSIVLITGLVFLLSGTWFLLRNIILGSFNVLYYRLVPRGIGPLLFIVGISILIIGIGIEHKMKRLINITISISFIFYLFELVFVLFFEPRGYLSGMILLDYIKQSSNVIPFKNISTYARALFDGSMNMDIPLTNLFGNLLLFLPMGVYFPYCIKKANKISVYCICMIIILFIIEIVQLITRRGIFDIDDIILRILGAFIGFTIYKSKAVQNILNW